LLDEIVLILIREIGYIFVIRYELILIKEKRWIFIIKLVSILMREKKREYHKTI